MKFWNFTNLPFSLRHTHIHRVPTGEVLYRPITSQDIFSIQKQRARQTRDVDAEKKRFMFARVSVVARVTSTRRPEGVRACVRAFIRGTSARESATRANARRWVR